MHALAHTIHPPLPPEVIRPSARWSASPGTPDPPAAGIPCWQSSYPHPHKDSEVHDWPRIDFCAEAVDGSIAISGGRNWWTGERLSDVWLSDGRLLCAGEWSARRWVEGLDAVRFRIFCSLMIQL